MSTYRSIDHTSETCTLSLWLLQVDSAFAAKLGIVALQDGLDGWLELRLVGAHHDEDAQIVRVHVRVGKQPRAREVLLNVGLVREVRRDLLEHDEVQREARAQLPKQLEVVHDAVARDVRLDFRPRCLCSVVGDQVWKEIARFLDKQLLDSLEDI